MVVVPFHNLSGLLQTGVASSTDQVRTNRVDYIKDYIKHFLQVSLAEVPHDQHEDEQILQEVQQDG